MQFSRPFHLSALALAVSQAGTASAATITVDADCTLVEAILSAENVNPEPGCETGGAADVIVLPSNSTQTLTTGFLNAPGNTFTGLPFVRSEITIEGNDSTILRASAGGFRILTVFDSGNLTLNDTEITGGNLGSNFAGGGAYVAANAALTLNNSSVSNNTAVGKGGGIYNKGTVTLNDSLVRYNNTTGDAGGGVFVTGTGTLTTQNSLIFNNTAAQQGGGVYSTGIVNLNGTGVNANQSYARGGAIYSKGSLSISGGTFNANSAQAGGGLALFGGMSEVTSLRLQGSESTAGTPGESGGGILVFGGELTIRDSIVTNNFSVGYGGGMTAVAGAQVDIYNSTISANSVISGCCVGGGIHFSGAGESSILESTIAANFAPNNGGGIYLAGTDAMQIGRSTISDNVVGLRGGGLFLQGADALSLENSTLSGNTVTSTNINASGGGLYATIDSTSLNIIHSTITNNSANTSGGLSLRVGTGGSIVNTILSGNESPFVVDMYVQTGNFDAFKNNLIGNSSITQVKSISNFTPDNSNILATSDGDQPTAASNIMEALTNNGGTGAGSSIYNPFTHALVSGSPAINSADQTICAIAPINRRDQRGERRGGACDIGAFELQDDGCFVIRAANGNVLTFCL